MLSQKLIIKAMATTSVIASFSVYAQVKNFKSKTRFRPNQTKQTESFKDNSFGTDSSTFGKRVNNSPISKDDKFVKLNPETGFGPEVITSFDFPDTDIMELTKHMQKLTGINLILDKDVKGKVSITAPTAITVGDAWKAYLTALDMAGYTLVKSGAFYKVINTRDVRYTPTKIYTGKYTPSTDTHMMKVISLKNIDATEISRNFRPFMSRYGRIIEMKQTNSVIISDTGSNIARLEKLIQFLDVPGYDESLQIIKVKNSSAQEIAKLLEEIVKSSGGSSSSSRPSSSSSRSSSRFSSSSNKGSGGISKIIAEPRTNSIIAMANANGAKQLRSLIKKLDVPLVSSNSDKIHVLYLNYGNAEELAKTLSNLVSNATQNKPNNSPARGFIRNQIQQNSLFNGEVKVTADKNNNALVVTASPTDWLTLKNVIGKLDIPRDQVYVEGLIVETSIDRIKSWGVEYLGAYGSGAAQRAGFTSGAAGGIVDLISGNPTNLTGLFVGGGGAGSREIDLGNGNKITVNSVNGLIKAISSKENSNVLATPQILAMDNTEAEFSVGSTIPVRTSTTTNGTIQETVTNQEAKLTLKITPQINKVTRFVTLKINQEINDFTGDVSIDGGGAATNTRSAVTEIMVRDRDTIAMGGLLRDKESIGLSKVPLLGDIPVLGWLFKSKSKKINKINLLMFLTPRILSPYDKEANKNTLQAIQRSKRDLKELSDPDIGYIPHKKEFQRLEAKIKKQQEGPLYDTAVPNKYEESNEDIQGIGNPSSESYEIPDYQEMYNENKDS